MSEDVTAPQVTPVDQGLDVADQKKVPGQTPKTQGGPQAGDVKAAAQEVMRKLKYKTKDGADAEVDEAEALKVYQDRKLHQSEASRQLNEGKALRKQAEEFISMLKDEGKLKDVLKKMGHDPRKLSEKILAEHLEDELMDPRDKDLRDTKAKLKQLEDMEKMQKDAVEKQRLEHVKERFRKEYETDFVKALGDSGLPPTKPMVAEMAKYIYQSAKIGFKMSADEAAKLVREDLQMSIQRLTGDSDGDTLLKLLGPEAANKIRKFDTAKLKNPEADLKTPGEPHKPRERNVQKRMSSREWQLHKRGLK